MANNAYSARSIYKILNVISGNFFEMYDFILFGIYAPILATVFFPIKNNYKYSLILTLLTFAVGFLMRPLGAIFLGAYIDKYGRKKGLILTLSLMAIGTCTIAFCPGYSSLGIIAPCLVLLGRLLQGFSSGAELAGASIYLAEIAPANKRGFYVSWQPASQQVAVIIAAIFGFFLPDFFSPSEMLAYGWRIPFIFGCIVLPIIFFQRMYLEETIAFKQQIHKLGLHKIVRNLLKSMPFIFTCSLLVMLTTVSLQMIVIYAPVYLKIATRLTSAQIFLLIICIGIFNFMLLPVMGWLSDKLGRLRLLIFFSCSFILMAYPVLHWVMQSPTFSNMLLAEIFLSFLYAGYTGSMVISLVEIVNFEMRSTSFSFAHSIAAAIYGGFTPYISTVLINLTGNRACPGVWLSFAAAMSLLAVVILKIKYKKNFI